MAAVALSVGALTASTFASPPASAVGSSGKSLTITSQHVANVGTVLATKSGLTLYRYSVDPAGKATCTGACAKVWPPLLLPKGVTHLKAPHGVKGLSVVHVTGGRLQVFFHHQALYTFVSDKKKGQASGQGVENDWFAVLSSGKSSASVSALDVELRRRRRPRRQPRRRRHDAHAAPPPPVTTTTQPPATTTTAPSRDPAHVAANDDAAPGAPDARSRQATTVGGGGTGWGGGRGEHDGAVDLDRSVTSLGNGRERRRFPGYRAIVTSDACPPTGNGPPRVSPAGRGGCGGCRGNSSGRKPGRVFGRLGSFPSGRVDHDQYVGPLRSPPQWSVLAGMLSGTLVVPGDATYANDALLFNELITTPQPAAIAYCASAADVQRCVAYARAHDVPLAARSGGHSYAGYSSSSGLVIDVSSLNSVSVASGMQLATVGAGAQLVDVYNQLGNRRPPPSGRILPHRRHCRTGARRRNRRLRAGLRHDVRQHRIAGDGHRRWIPAPVHPPQQRDLYWASRGGGGGNFGIVTSFTFTVHPIPDVTLFTLDWPWGEAANVLDAFLRWIPTAPNELWANCQLAANGREQRIPEGDRCVRRIDGRMFERAAPITFRRRCGAVLAIRRTRELPPGHVDRGGMRELDRRAMPLALAQPRWNVVPIAPSRRSLPT